MTENAIICLLAAWSFTVVLFMAEGAYYGLNRLYKRLRAIQRRLGNER